MSGKPAQKPKPTLSQPKKEYQLHAFHCFGDLQLRSNDNITFKVISIRLAGVSTVFKDMLELGNQATSTGTKRKFTAETELIDIGFPATTLEVFLDIINVPNPVIPALDFASALGLYEFCDKYDVVTKIKEPIKTRLLDNNASGHQWALLLWSERRNDMEMTRQSLKIMTEHGYLYPRILDDTYKSKDIDFWMAMSRLPIHWRYELLRLAFEPPSKSESPYTRGHPYCLSLTWKWDSVAAAFNPEFLT